MHKSRKPSLCVFNTPSPRYRSCFSDFESGSDTDPTVQANGAAAGSEEAISLGHDVAMQQQSGESTYGPADVRVARVAHRHGLHPSEEHGGTEDIRYGVLLVPHAPSSCHQARVWRLACVGRHVGHRALQSESVCEMHNSQSIARNVLTTFNYTRRYPTRNSSFNLPKCTSITSDRDPTTSRTPN